MNTVHRYILFITEIVVLYFSIGLAATFWVNGLFLLCFGILRMSVHFVPLQDRYVTSRVMSVCMYTNLALAIGACIFIFIRFGWVAAAGFIVLNIAVPSLRLRQRKNEGLLSNNCQDLLKQYKANGQIASLNQAVECWQKFLTMAPPISPNLPRWLINLSIALDERYKRIGNLADLDASIVAIKQAVQALPRNDPIRPTLLGNLDIQLHERYTHNKEITDLDAAIAAIEQAIEAIPSNSPDRSGFLDILGRRQMERYKHTEELTDLDASIAANQQAGQAPPHELLDRPTLLNNLGRGLNKRYERTGDITDLDAAIATFEQASQITPPDSPKWRVYLDNLSSVLRERYKRTGNRADLDAAIAAFGKVVQTVTSTLPDRLVLLSSLGARQLEQYRQTENLADLEMSITLCEQALQATSPSSPDRPGRLNSLGTVLHERYKRTRELGDLEAANAAFEQVIQATSIDSPDRPARLNNLVVGLTELYERTGDLADLKAVITDFQQAIQAVSADSPAYLNSLGGGRLVLYKRTDDLGELNRAISTFEQAIQSTADPSNQSLCLTNLGIALIARYNHNYNHYHIRNKTDLDAAIINFQQAIQMLPADSPMQYTLLSNLGRSLHQRLAHAYNLTDLEASISAWEKCWSILHLRFAAIPVIYQLGQQRQEAMIAADLVTAYLEQATLRSSPVIARLLKTLDDENGSKSLLTQAIATFALFLIKPYQEWWGRQNSRLLGVPTLLHVPPRVLEITEGNKSRLLTQLIGRGPLPLPLGLSSDIAAREQQLLSKLTRLDTEELVRHDNLYAIQEENAHLQLPRLQQRQTTLHELENLWSHIAHISPEGIEYVALRRGTTPTWEEFTRLTNALGATTVLLSFFVTVGQAVLVIFRAGWQTPRVSAATLNQAGWADLRKNLKSEVYRPEKQQKTTWELPLLPLLTDVRPHMKGVEKIILAPVDKGHLLPWSVLMEHAGWRTPTGEKMPLITLPALGILPRLRRRPHISSGPVLVVGDPRGDLPDAKAEAEEVAKRFDTEALLGTSATKSAVLARFPDATLIHIAAHASFNAEKPLESKIELAGDDVLTAREILQHRLQTDLLVLSACESGQVGSLGGEELAGLSQAFLQAGVRSLLVSLWKVNSPATSELMRAFYTAREAGDDKAQALRQAMTSLQNEPRWSHPYYWGAFVLMGDWD